ncbi:MAG: gliding motility-associated C-terminal domain-containing protein [Bacteroidota bacterium]
MKKDDNIEDLFKEKFENFEADVNPSVWKNVQTALKGFGLGFLVKSLLNKIGTTTLVAVVSSVVTVVSTVMVMNWTGDAKKEETADKKPVTTQAIVETTVPAATNNVVDTKEETKPVVIPVTENNAVVKNETSETKLPLVKTDKKEMESVINTYSKNQIADILASPISVTVATPVSLINNGTGKINKWTFGDDKTVSTDARPVHWYSEPGIYTVKLTSTNAEGKTAVDSVKIEVLGNSSPSAIPADFSPNGDKVLDEFAFKIGENIVHHSAIIFDNKGNPVFEKEGHENFIWDGKDKKDKEVKVGMYFYIYNAEGVDGKKYKREGSINLTR